GRWLGEEALARVHAALLDAVAAGRLPEPRLHEAAGRVLRAAEWAAAGGEAAAPDSSAGVTAARRALLAEGDLAIDGPLLVVGLQPDANVAAGPAEHSLGRMLAARVPGTTVVDSAPAGRNGRQPGARVRHAHRP